MSSIEDKINSALGIDISKALKDADNDIPETSPKEIEKYNKRKEIISNLKQDLKDARSLEDSKWAELYLKQSAEKQVEVQEIFRQEIEDSPCSKNVTAFSELANALSNTVTNVLDIKREEERLAISKEKNDLRRMEVEKDMGPILNSIDPNKDVIAVGSNDDLLKLIEKGIDPTNSNEKGEHNATSKTN